MNSNYFWSLLLGVAIGFWIASQYIATPNTDSPSSAPYTRVEIHYDTIRLASIAPVEVLPLAEPCDTIASPPLDTIAIVAPSHPSSSSPLALYTFRDTVADRWSAQIVGRNVELQSLTLTTPYHHTTEYRPPRWEVAAYSHIGRFSQWVGVETSHNIGRMRLSAHVGYDAHHSSLTYGARVGVALWSRY